MLDFQSFSKVYFLLYLHLYTQGNCNKASCKDDENVLCNFHSSDDPAPQCNYYEKLITSEKQKLDILNKINSRRNKVASGEIRSLPPAVNMLKLVWHEELSISAQKWANQCSKHSMPDLKDPCLKGKSIGQNIATIYGDAPGLNPLTLVDVWYTELLNINSSVLSKYQRSYISRSSHYDYFTQLVWARSSRVGCGGVKFKERLHSDQFNRTIFRLVCNFNPGGNEIGQAVYSAGQPCTRCFQGKCDKTFNSLCSNSEEKLSKSFQVHEVISFTDNASLMNNSSIFHNDTRIVIANKDVEDLEINTNSTPNIGEDESYTPFDFLSHIREFSPKVLTTAKLTSCKDVLDDFIDLLKKKINNDPSFKDFISNKLLGQNTNEGDSSFTDASVAAFANNIYNKKETTIPIKTTDNETLNSTLLIDLVEAVIFRNSDKVFSTLDMEQVTKPIPGVKPVKIHAQMPSVQTNRQFTGNYFFPEDDFNDTSSDKSEIDYETSEVSESDLASEIEDIKRRKDTKDFLDEILENEYSADNTPISLASSSDINLYQMGRNNMKKFLDEIVETSTQGSDNENKGSDQYENIGINKRKRRIRRRSVKDGINVSKHLRKDRMPCCKTGFYSVKYSDLLKYIAADLKILKLNERFHCSHAITKSLSVTIKVSNYWSIVIICNILCFY